LEFNESPGYIFGIPFHGIVDKKVKERMSLFTFNSRGSSAPALDLTSNTKLTAVASGGDGIVSLESKTNVGG